MNDIGTLDYRIGLDIGTNSVGWSIVELLYNGERYEKIGLLDAGVRMFDRAEVPKTGASLALPRRLARSTRRRLKRKASRKKAIRNLLLQYDIVNELELDKMYQKDNLVDIWTIRIEALDRRLGREEWARLLIHLSQKRGYKSTRKSEELSKDAGVVLSSIQENEDRLKKYRTVGEMWVKDESFEGRRHNSINEYKFNVTRKQLEDEIRLLFKVQRDLGSNCAKEELEKNYLKIWGHQLPFASGSDILKKVGYCSLIKSERRLPKATCTFQYFMSLDKLNKIRIKPSLRKLTEEERSTILSHLFDRNDLIKKKSVPKIRYADIRKVLNLPTSETFNDLTYHPEKLQSKNEEKIFVNLDAYYSIKKLCDEHSEVYNPIDYDAIAYALTVYKTDQDIIGYLSNRNNLANRKFNEELIKNLLNYSYSTFGNLSRKGINEVLPLMNDGLTFKEAADEAGFDTTGLSNVKKEKFLTIIPDDIANPVVKRSLTQARKIVNSIIKEMGEQPHSVHIELARELSKDHSERRKIIKEQYENRQKNTGAVEILAENGILNPTGHDIVRYKLWKEQGGKCAYSLKPIPAYEFFQELKSERNRAPKLDVDHIIPYSKCFDDSYLNKVLVYSDQNRIKGDRIPFEYFGDSEKRWGDFESFVRTSLMPIKKQNRLLKKTFLEEEELLIKERHLNDTRYASRFFKNFLKKNLLFKSSEKHNDKKRVECVPGKITAHFRKRWGFEKHRENTHLHHALDAIVVACTDTGMIQSVTRYYKHKESGRRNVDKHFPQPWETFRDEVLNKLSQVAIPETIANALYSRLHQSEYMLVSRMARKSITGSAHKETISSFGGFDEKGKALVVQKVKLSDIKFNKSGDFDMHNKETDLATYNAIKNRFLEHNQNIKNAFSLPLYKPSKKGNGNLIKSVKVIKERKSMVRTVNGGVAENGDLVRVDFFLKDNKYVMVPIYTIDTIQPKLPNRYVQSGKGYEKWLELTDEHEFVLSVCPYELLRVQTNKGIDRLYYFSSLNITNNVIKLSECNIPNKDYIEIGVGSLSNLEKYEINILGKILRKIEEPRLNFNNNKSKNRKQG